MIKAIAITGPTASGKTALSLALAERLGCEIISMDSMQIYRGMDIGTAKATDEQRAAVAHHMIDIAEPDESFSAKDYRDMALGIAESIAGRGKIPLFVGGTGLYLSTLMRAGQDSVPEASREYRERLLSEATDDEGRLRLWRRLAEVDAPSAVAIHPNNLRRVIRALEIYEKTGIPKSRFDEESRRALPPFDLTHVTIDFHDRELLYRGIDQRVDEMIKEGLVEEAIALYRNGRLPQNSTAYQAIGYKEILELYKTGASSLEAAADAIKQASRNYAKRQLTWFRNQSGAKTLFADRENGGRKSFAELFAELCELIAE